MAPPEDAMTDPAENFSSAATKAGRSLGFAAKPAERAARIEAWRQHLRSVARRDGDAPAWHRARSGASYGAVMADDPAGQPVGGKE